MTLRGRMIEVAATPVVQKKSRLDELNLFFTVKVSPDGVGRSVWEPGRVGEVTKKRLI
jgi:hypothetical protein